MSSCVIIITYITIAKPFLDEIRMKLRFAKTLSCFDGLLSGRINGAKVFIWKTYSL